MSRLRAHAGGLRRNNRTCLELRWAKSALSLFSQLQLSASNSCTHVPPAFIGRLICATMLLTTASSITGSVLAKVYTCLQMSLRRDPKLRIGNVTKDLVRFAHRLQCNSHGGVAGANRLVPCHALGSTLARWSASPLHHQSRFSSVCTSHRLVESPGLRNFATTDQRVSSSWPSKPIVAGLGGRRHFDVVTEYQVWQLQRPTEEGRHRQ